MGEWKYAPSTGVIVTGGGSGLGRATALLLAEVGRPIAVWDVKGAQEAAAECAERFGVTAIGQTVDVADREAVFRAVDESEKRLGSIGGLVAAAAVLRYGPVGTIDPKDWADTLNINLSGPLHCIEGVLPALRRAMPGSAIVVISSTEGVRGHPYIPAYTASKHGVLGLVRAMSRSLGAEGIRANAVCPGAMDTPMLRAGLASTGEEQKAAMLASVPLGRAADPSEVGRVARFLLSEDSSYMTGAAVLADGGMTASGT